MYCSLMILLLLFVPIFAIRTDRYEALHGYFSTRSNGDPATLWMIGIGFLVLIVIMTIYHFIHIKMLKHYHKKMMKENEKTLYKILENNEKDEK